MAMEAAFDRVAVVLEVVAKRYIEDGHFLGYVKPTWGALKKLPEDEAIGTVARMIVQPYYRKQGFEFARKMVEGLPDSEARLQQLGMMEQSYAQPT